MRRRLSGRQRPVLALGTIAASAFLLSGCGDEAPTDKVFSSVDQCVSSGMDREVCQVAYQDAIKGHLDNAPRFDAKAACEAEYGDSQCIEQHGNSNSGGGSFFTPFLTGYLVSSAVNNIGDYYSYRRQQEATGSYGGATPIYRNRAGQTLTTGTTAPSGNGSAASSSRQSVKPVNVNTRSVARQGFGGRSSFGFGG